MNNSNSQNLAIVDAINVAVIVVSYDPWTVQYLNRAARQWTGLSEGDDLTAALPSINQSRIVSRLSQGRSISHKQSSICDPSFSVEFSFKQQTDGTYLIEGHNTAAVDEIQAMLNSYSAMLEKQNQEIIQEKDRLAQVLYDLQVTQSQLIQAEKMASLGLLVSNVAHEINTPMGAVKSSGALIAESFNSVIESLPLLLDSLERQHRDLFIKLVKINTRSNELMSTRDERRITKEVSDLLEEAGVEGSIRKARLLVRLHAHDDPLEFLPLLVSEKTDFILNVAAGVADVLNGTNNIDYAVTKVSRIVYALKTLSGDDNNSVISQGSLVNDMEMALTKHFSQMRTVELVRNYKSNLPFINADHEALQQLFIHLVMNALQAMNYNGLLKISIDAQNDTALIAMEDSGTGIADHIKDRIYEPFFSTRTSGEGSGMGLAIVKKIVEQHRGSIHFNTVPSKGTTFKVNLPYLSS